MYTIGKVDGLIKRMAREVILYVRWYKLSFRWQGMTQNKGEEI